MNVVRFCRENRYAVYLVTGFLVAAGLWAMFVLPSNIYPELNFPRIAILIHAGDLAPEAMLLTVTRPLEEAASTVLGVRRVRSRTPSTVLAASSSGRVTVSSIASGARSPACIRIAIRGKFSSG